MNKKYLLIVLFVLIASNLRAQSNDILVFDNVVFYDGYADTSTLPTQTNVVRLENSRYAKKLNAAEISSFLNTLSLNVKINALCDNYDRQGGVFFAFVPTGEPITSASKETIEIGRFITPFMNKNVAPNEVNYNYDLNHLIGVFKDSDFLLNNDIWVEFFLFGVPYAAHNEIPGCAGRADVFQGTLTFTSTSGANPNMNSIPKPLWSRLRMNKTNDSDFVGYAGRVIYFTNYEMLNDANIQLITSAHGANSGGEEYVRRDHFVFFDNNQVLTYKPGGLSCEPFRQYNTQANQIYGTTVKTAAWWAQWNNWCPGDKIPNRIISLGNVSAGDHSFKITVPTGQFPNSNDEIYISAFIYSNDNAVLANEQFEIIDYAIYPNPTQDFINIETSKEIKEVLIYDSLGKNVLKSNESRIDITRLPVGLYHLQIEFKNGKKLSEKIIKSN